ncbi:hypothetical protein BGZ82_005111, partial [Podila clonocystis]
MSYPAETCTTFRRTVLLGDACQKFIPAEGAGALTTIYDAVALANWINTLESATLFDLDTIFKEYRDERYLVVEELLGSSKCSIGLGE